MLDQKYLEILDHGLRLRDDRANWLRLWEELRDVFYPDAASFLSEETPGDERRSGSYTSTPELARRGLSTAIQAMMRPDGKRWFKAKPKRTMLEGDEAVRQWLEIVTAITYAALSDARANAAKALAEADCGLVTFGTAIVHVGWNPKGRHLVLRSEDLRSSVLFLDQFGNAGGVYLFKTLTLRQLVEQFGDDALTKPMREKLAQKGAKGVDLDQTFEIAHACIPNADYARYGFKPGNFPFASLWFSVKCRELIGNPAGYWSLPYICPRWETASGEIYGRSPAMVALNDARALLKMEETFLDAGESAVKPPLGAWGDLIRGDVQLWSGGLTLFDAAQGGFDKGPPIWPIQTGELPREVLQYMEVKQQRVEAAFYRDILELPKPDAEKMTAAEIGARHDQYIRQAAPVFGRIEANYNAPLVDRIFNILWENNAFPPPPDSLHGEEIEFEYESPLKMARDRSEALKVLEGLGMIQQVSAGLSPDKAIQIQDNFDVDVIARYLGMKTDLPQILFTPLQVMLEGREQRAKEMKQMQMAEMASKLGPAIGQIGSMAAKAKESGLLGGSEPFPFAATDLDPAQMIEASEGIDYTEVMA